MDDINYNLENQEVVKTYVNQIAIPARRSIVLRRMLEVLPKYNHVKLVCVNGEWSQELTDMLHEIYHLLPKHSESNRLY